MSAVHFIQEIKLVSTIQLYGHKFSLRHKRHDIMQRRLYMFYWLKHGFWLHRALQIIVSQRIVSWKFSTFIETNRYKYEWKIKLPKPSQFTRELYKIAFCHRCFLMLTPRKYSTRLFKINESLQTQAIPSYWSRLKKNVGISWTDWLTTAKNMVFKSTYLKFQKPPGFSSETEQYGRLKS
jgi:hypothetical protein